MFDFHVNLVKAAKIMRLEIWCYSYVVSCSENIIILLMPRVMVLG